MKFQALKSETRAMWGNQIPTKSALGIGANGYLQNQMSLMVLK